MSEDILINSMPMEDRVAVLERGVLQELHIERPARSIVGNIYLGKIVRILPGMQAAFVDIGTGKAAFLQDSHHTHKKSVQVLQEQDKPQATDAADINKQFYEGQAVLVQVSKDAVLSKGARVTTQLSIPSRYLVYMPDSEHIGISLRIEQEEERHRLRELLEQCLAELNEYMISGGFIIRTAAERFLDKQNLMEDLHYLHRMWKDIQQAKSLQQAPYCIYQDLPLIKRVIRDLTLAKTDRIRVDQRSVYKQLKQFCEQYVPTIQTKLELYKGDSSLFELYGVEEQIKQVLSHKVSLKSGGYITIDQTEALTTIDVNTGGFVGKKDLQETIVQTNKEAAVVAARQLRLRNIGGIVVIDFIDMDDVEHQQSVLKVLEKEKEKDHAKIRISGLSGLGLVELSRKRTRESLGHLLSEQCPYCGGVGRIKTLETIGFEILRQLYRQIIRDKPKPHGIVRIVAALEVIHWLRLHAKVELEELEQVLACTIQMIEMQHDLDTLKSKKYILREHYRVEY